MQLYPPLQGVSLWPSEFDRASAWEAVELKPEVGHVILDISVMGPYIARLNDNDSPNLFCETELSDSDPGQLRFNFLKTLLASLYKL